MLKTSTLGCERLARLADDWMEATALIKVGSFQRQAEACRYRCAKRPPDQRLQILWRITLPLAVPGLISAGIFAFTLSWNEFIYALAFIQSTEKKTVPVAILTELVTGDVYQWGSLMAGSLLGSVPVAIIYSFFVEYYVSSMTGAVKE